MAKKDDSPFITTGERVRSFIGWAFVISIGVHFLLSPFLKNMTQHTEEQTVEKVSVTKKIQVKVPTPPPPTPTPPPPKTTPPPQPKQQQQPQPKLKIAPPKITSNNASTTSSEQKYVPPKTGSQNGVPAGTVASAAPAPPAPATAPPGTPKPACKTPYQDATAVQSCAARVSRCGARAGTRRGPSYRRRNDLTQRKFGECDDRAVSRQHVARSSRAFRGASIDVRTENRQLPAR